MIKCRVVKKEFAAEREADRSGNLHSCDFDECKAEAIVRQERLAEASEKYLHPRLHEFSFGTLARPVQLRKSIEIRCEGFASRIDNVVSTSVRFQSSSLPLYLVPKLRCERRQPLVLRRRKFQKWSDVVFFYLSPKSLPCTSFGQRRQPGGFFGETKKVRARPVRTGSQ